MNLFSGVITYTRRSTEGDAALFSEDGLKSVHQMVATHFLAHQLNYRDQGGISFTWIES